MMDPNTYTDSSPTTSMELTVDEDYYDGPNTVSAYNVVSYGGSGGIIGVDVECVNNSDEPMYAPIASNFTLEVDGELGELTPLFKLTNFDGDEIAPREYTDGTIVFEVVRAVSPREVTVVLDWPHPDGSTTHVEWVAQDATNSTE